MSLRQNACVLIQWLCLPTDGLTFSYDYNYGIVRKGNADYLEPKKGKISYTLQGMNLRFDNLFNGDRLLGKLLVYETIRTKVKRSKCVAHQVLRLFY